jgi:hypothetical protein
MSLPIGAWRAVCAATPLTLVLCLNSADAQAPRSNRPPQSTTANMSNYRPEMTVPSSNHPLAAVIEYARREQAYLSQTVRDFSCRLVKRERINGILQDLHFIDMVVREHQEQDGQVVVPLSLYLHFLAPKNVVDRRVIYVEGQHAGKILLRNGGRHFDYVITDVDPNSDAAREETLVPVTEIGFNQLLDRMIDVLEKHRQLDPLGQNTKAERISGAKINGRPCNVVRITHAQKVPGLEFHIANVFVDSDLHVPVRVDYSDFPKIEGRPGELIAEYTYTNLELNVNPPDSTFDPSRLRE